MSRILALAGDAYRAPLYIDKEKNLTTGAIIDKKQYLHRDYLGSIIAISDEIGTAVERRQFDAWGNLAKLQQNGVAITLPTDGTAAGLILLDRDYTGHEHLQSVGLINMKCRLYDAKLHRFLQPDNYVQDPSNTQNFNRYGYCWNNPLKYTDPSGEIIPLIIAAIIVVSAAVNVYQNWGDITGGTGNFSDIKWGKFLAYGASGALTVYGGPLGSMGKWSTESIKFDYKRE